MAKQYAYLRTKPAEIKFVLNYSDDSEKLTVCLSPSQNDVLMKQGSDGILIAVEDIDWLRQALDDLKEIVQLPNKEQKDERSVASTAK